jgi:preprotein translocase subunit SecE
MNEKAGENRQQGNTSAFDAIRWLVVAVGFISAVYGYYNYDESVGATYKIVGLIFVGVLLVLIAVGTTQGARSVKLLRESILEAKKVSWPTKQEANQTALLVMAVVLLASLILFVIDLLFNWLTSALIG